MSRCRADQSAHRSELAGSVGIFLTAAVIVKQCVITGGGLSIAFDGESTVNKASGEWPLCTDQPCFDLLREIRNCVKSLSIDIH